MILLNMTFAVDSSLSDTFLSYIRDEFIPALKKAGYRRPLLTEMRDPAHDAAGHTYALQFRAQSAEAAEAFEDSISPLVLRKISGEWQGRSACFCSVLDVVYDPEKDD